MSHAAHPAVGETIQGHALGHGAAVPPADFSAENITLPPQRGDSLSLMLMVVGAIGLAVLVIGGFMLPSGEGLRHALAAYQVGVMAALAISLGGMFFVMAFHLTAAGWSATIRRQFENLMRLVPWMALLVLPVLAIEMWTGGQLFLWLDSDLKAHDTLLVHKAPYLNAWFFTGRAVIYFCVWFVLAWLLWGYSKEQDATGDKWLTNRAARTSTWGMLLFALTVAFASFDWLMSMDYRFFSTIWGVYYFAGAAYSSLAVVVFVLALCLRAGKLKGLVTEEHFHDLAKLMFAFTVFWAYIAFSQYFLIWYANIPEETAFMLARKTGGWEHYSMVLVVGHFILPFFILLWRFVRRSYALLMAIALWMLVMHVIDIAWLVRPFVYGPIIFEDKVRVDRVWMDIAGVVGVLGIFGGLLVRNVFSGPLVATRDPRIAESLHHRNYV
jgi:hypothetical protein